MLTFCEEYNVRLRYPHLPVVDVGTQDNPAYIPPELCTVVKGQPFKGRLDDRQTESMLKVAKKTPAENASFITGQGSEVVGITEAKQRDGWLVGLPFLVIDADLQE